MTSIDAPENVHRAERDIDRQPRIMLPVIALVLAVGLIIRFFGIGDRSMFDDAASWTFATLPWTSFWKAIWNYDGNMVFYYLLLRVWTIFGDSEAAIRSLSVVFGVAGLATIYALGVRLFSWRTGLIATILLAVHAFHIRFSQEARSYALTTFLLMVSTLLFVHALKARSRRVWVGYVIVSTLACYSQLLSVLVLAAQWLWFLGTDGFKGLQDKIKVLAAMAISIVPIGIYAIAKDGGQVDWIRPLTRNNFIEAVTTLAGGSLGLLLLYVALCMLALYIAVKFRHEATLTRNTMLLLIWALLPPIILALVSTVRPMFVDRYILMCVPAVLLLAASALDRLLTGSNAMKGAGIVAGLAIVGMSAHASIQQYQAVVREPNPLKEFTQHILRNQQSDDAVIFFTAATHMSFNYYIARSTPTERTMTPRIIIPDFGDAPTGAQPIPTAEELENATAGHGRVWLVLNQSGIRLVPGAKEGLPVVENTIESHFVRKQEKQFSYLILRLYERM